MEPLLGALLIFVLRICDVSVGTMRVMFTVRGLRAPAMVLGFVEAGIWILAVRQVFDQLDNWWNIVGYAAGFAAGTFVGITIERWIASGWILLRVISVQKHQELLEALRAAHFGITAVPGEGKNGPVQILFVVTKRKRGQEAMALVRSIDRSAFVTLDTVALAAGGYLPSVAGSSVRK
jgi:uncharacterized protein YebE (UPF0316 family)